MPMMLGIGAGAGLLKYGLVDQPKYAAQKQLAASTQRYSPWTHMTASAPDQPSAVGDAMQGAGTGAMLGGQIGLQNAQKNWLQNNPYNSQVAGASAMGTGGGDSFDYYNQSNPWVNMMSK